LTIWQIAAGDSGGRDYTQLCIEHDVMLIGPGNPGNYKENPKGYVAEHMRSQIASFCNNTKAGDLVLLRYGRRVMAVGMIPEQESEYQWQEVFDDVLGWDMQHTRRVVWDENALPILNPIQPVFGHMKQMPTLTRVQDARITNFEKALLPQNIRLNKVRRRDI
jgi:predicted Mrr-cat superfamily restriction endonuclease